jgi:hypothetical protein
LWLQNITKKKQIVKKKKSKSAFFCRLNLIFLGPKKYFASGIYALRSKVISPFLCLIKGLVPQARPLCAQS